MKKLIIISFFTFILFSCKKTLTSDLDNKINAGDKEIKTDVSLKTIENTEWKATAKVTSEKTRNYNGIKFMSDSMATLTGIEYRDVNKPSDEQITKENDIAKFTYKLSSANNKTTDEINIFKSYDIIVYQKYASLTDDEKQKLINKNMVPKGDDTRVIFFMFKYKEKTTTTSESLDPNFKSQFNDISFIKISK